MFVLRFIGFGFSTASYSLIMTYLGESVGSSRRRRYLFLLNSANLSAEFFFYGLAYFILPLNISWPAPWLGITITPWRVYNLILLTPQGISALLLFYLYESPKFLASMGKMEQALKVLNDIYKRNGGKDEYPVKMLNTEGEETRTKGPFWTTLVEQTKPLFKTPLLWRTIQLYYLVAICSSTNNAFLMWYPMIVNIFYKSISYGNNQSMSFCERFTSNMTLNDNAQSADYVCDNTIHSNMLFAGMFLGLLFIVVPLAATLVATHRRLVLIACFLVSGVCLILVDFLRESISTMVAFTLMQITTVGVASVSTYFVDLYPISSRGLVSSLSTIFMRLFSLAGINIVAYFLVNHCRLTFFGWSVYVASGIVVALFLPSDLKMYK